MASKTKEYKPSEKEKFMNARQLAYFKEKLLAWRTEIQRDSAETVESLQEHNLNAPDLADRATSESDRSIELRARDRQRKLISKINQALKTHRRRRIWIL